MGVFKKNNPGNCVDPNCGCGSSVAPCTAGSCVQALLDAGFPAGSTPLSVSTPLGDFTMAGTIAAGPGCFASWAACHDFTASGIDNRTDPPAAATIAFPVSFALACSGTSFGFSATYLSDYRVGAPGTNYIISGAPAPNDQPINCCPIQSPPRDARACGGVLGCGTGGDYGPADSVTIPLGSITYPLNLTIPSGLPIFGGGNIVITGP